MCVFVCLDIYTYLYICVLCVCLVAQSCLTLQPHGPLGSSYPWGSSKQEYWSGLPCPPPGNRPNPWIEPRSSTLRADSLPSEPLGKPLYMCVYIYRLQSLGLQSRTRLGDFTFLFFPVHNRYIYLYTYNYMLYTMYTYNM